jgi:hypothetical protein
MTEDKDLVKVNIEPINDTVNDPQFINAMIGMIRTVSTPSTGTPTRLIDQIEIYINGGTKLLRIYDTTNNTWRELTIN